MPIDMIPSNRMPLTRPYARAVPLDPFVRSTTLPTRHQYFSTIFAKIPTCYTEKRTTKNKKMFAEHKRQTQFHIRVDQKFIPRALASATAAGKFIPTIYFCGNYYILSEPCEYDLAVQIANIKLHEVKTAMIQAGKNLLPQPENNL